MVAEVGESNGIGRTLVLVEVVDRDDAVVPNGDDGEDECRCRG